MRVTRSPKDVEFVVAGGRRGHSVVILPWALHSDAIVEPVLLPFGEVPASIPLLRVARRPPHPRPGPSRMESVWSCWQRGGGRDHRAATGSPQTVTV
jgi:hypothetical protein